MTKNNKYNCNFLLCLAVRQGVDGGLNSVFGHIYSKNYSKIKTSFYFAFSSFTLQAFAILYFSYL